MEELNQLNDLIPQVQDWDKLIHNCIDRGIAPLFYKKLPLLSNNKLIPEYVKEKLQQAYFRTFSRSTLLYEHFRKTVEVFNQNNIPVIALKGIYLSEYMYQDIGLRQFSDIDLLVKEEDGLRCLEILTGLGYMPFDSKESEFILKARSEIVHYTPMILNGASIEIHIKLNRSTDSYNLKPERLWENAELTTIYNTPVYTLNKTDLLIHLCIHADKHFRSGNIQFTCFSDITNILVNFKTDSDWALLIEKSKQYHCENIVFQYLVLVNKYMNASVPDQIFQKYSHCLTKKTEHQFLKYLNGSNTHTSIPDHLQNYKNFETFSERLRYSWEIVFPPKAFMIQKYKIKHPSLFVLYYPYRYWVGMKGIIKLFASRYLLCCYSQ